MDSANPIPTSICFSLLLFIQQQSPAIAGLLTIVQVT